jgi:hypothetical protein
MHLDIVSLVTPRVPGGRVARNIRKTLHSPSEREVTFRHFKLERNATNPLHPLPMVCHYVIEAGKTHSVLGEALEVDVRHDDLFLGGKSL